MFSRRKMKLITIITVLLTLVINNESSVLAQTQTEAVRSIEIIKLIEAAEHDISINRLTSPPNNNAFNKIKKVLTIEAKNERAQELLQLIINKYYELYQKHISSGDLIKAENCIKKMILVDPNQIEKFRKMSAKIKTEGIPILLQEIERRIEKNLLTTPEGKSAYEGLQEVLRYAPDNKRVSELRQKIMDKYLFLIKKRISGGDYTVADEYSKSLLKIVNDPKLKTEYEKEIKEAKNTHMNDNKISIEYFRVIPSKQLLLVRFTEISLQNEIKDLLSSKGYTFIDLFTKIGTSLTDTEKNDFFFLNEQKQFNPLDVRLLEKLTAKKYTLFFSSSNQNMISVINSLPEDQVLKSKYGVDYVGAVYHDSKRPKEHYSLFTYYLFSPHLKIKYKMQKNHTVDKLISEISDALSQNNLVSSMIENNEFNPSKIDFVTTKSVKVFMLEVLRTLRKSGIYEYASPIYLSL